MKAAFCDQYGPPDALEFREMPKPEPTDSQVLIRVHAASLNVLDYIIMRGKPFFVRLFFGLLKPKREILGSDFAGEVEAVGGKVTQFHTGDDVFGAKGFAGSAFAEYVCASEEELALKPAGISYEDAACVPVAGLTALQGLRDHGRIRAGQRVLVDGASGGVGTFAIEIAKAFGTEVTAVCSTRNLATARSIGADHVIDYTRDDFTRNGQRYDLILAANARHSIFAYMRALGRGGVLVKAGGNPTLQGAFEDLLIAPILSRMSGKKVCSFIAKLKQKDLICLAGFLEDGRIVPVIDRRYSLRDAAAAIAYLEEGHAQGKVALFFE
ncbi:quinone oxidoreductase [Acidisarcina polymorpha]|uniref:Quinone oxidoreductase n=1 Tax=Acidisarcina polymorpha TaxID=2211140 RepID=A0A2Z5G8R0_9BACT|nr:NAD(P)-dependent alcohol dehydrogenase [Acidisarcina polymorpha]AXC14956.1 quinone oxidoreductase [Acidisarcina polymorpha]